MSWMWPRVKAALVVAVLGYKHEEVRKVIPAGVKVAVQKKLIGTADAVKTGLRALSGFRGDILILYGDMPLVKVENLKKLIARHVDSGAAASILTATMADAGEYGRIIRDQYNGVRQIVEAKDADEFEKQVKEINTGIICFKKAKLEQALKHVRRNNRKKEFYLTDTIELLHTKGELIESLTLKEMKEAMGVNSRDELSQANKVIQGRINEELMKQGVSLVDPQSAFIAHGSKIGLDTTIYPFTVIENNVKIGKRCSIGPFAHLREGTRLEDDVIAGNFLEIVRTRISQKTWVKHFGYLGDTRIGKSANIGAGTVVANFDGKNKNESTIGDGAFIGCDTVMVSPVRIGKKAVTGAGSVVVRQTRVRDGQTVAGIPARPLKKQ
jgi:bifunctional UDP-N-acetylglucosamine pyrophosphorylase/glucosamine-1-phosphate N-acetyltransferase